MKLNPASSYEKEAKGIEIFRAAVVFNEGSLLQTG
jgi:hypothetical protein